MWRLISFTSLGEEEGDEQGEEVGEEVGDEPLEDVWEEESKSKFEEGEE